METTLRAYDRDGDRLGVLPWSALSRTIVRNAAGALTAQVPRSLLDPVLLGDEVYLRVAENGVEAPDWYLLDDDGEDDANAGGRARPVSIGATGVATILEWGTVYSWEYSPDEAALAARIARTERDKSEAAGRLAAEQAALQALRDSGSASADQIAEAEEKVRRAQLYLDAATRAVDLARAAPPGNGNLLGLDPTHGFVEVTPGRILKTFIDLAQERGCFPHLTYSFTDDVDSAGRPWPASYSRTYDAGITVGKVLDGMTEDGWVDWEMAGFRLDVYVPDTELAADFPESVLRLGRGVTAAPRKRSRKSARSVIFANGAEGAAVEVSDPDALARLGRREGYEGRSGITDFGTLTAATQVSLRRRTTASESITLELDASQAPPIPRPGGYVRYDQRRLTPTKLEPMRVQSVAWDYEEPARISVELADLWVDQDVRLARQVDAILNGSSANERVPVKNPQDTVPPAQVQGLALVSAPFEDPTTGQQFAQATASWLEVTRDVDGSSVDELAGYTIEWRQPEVVPGTKRVQAGAGQTLISWSPLVPGVDVEARIAAYDRYGNYGPWSDWLSVPTGVDETPPPRPTAPAVDNYLGLLRAAWDGGFIGGSARPADLHRIEVHVSAADGFDPNEDPDATLVGTLVAPGPVFVDTPYMAERFVRLVAVDTSGNRSDPSDQVSGASHAVVAADVFDGAIGSAKLADLAVTSAKINLLAVNSAQVGEIEVGKLTAGILNAQVIMGGRIATAESGQRVELNSLGIFRWNAAGELTVAIDDNGALLTGTYRTDLTGRRIEIGTTGNVGAISMYGPTGAQTFLRSVGTGTGEYVELGRVVDGRVDVHRIQLHSNGVTYNRALWQVTTFVNSYSINVATANGDAGQTVYRIDNGIGEHSWWPKAEAGRVVMREGDGFVSPHFKLINASGYGMTLSSYYPGAGEVYLQLKDVNHNGWGSLYAGKFYVASDRSTKTSIRTAPTKSLLDDVRGAKVRRYKRKSGGLLERDGEAPTVVDAPEEIGLIAQEAPAQILAPPAENGLLGVDIYQMAAMNWGATGELADLVEAQAEQIKELVAAVAALTKGKKP